MAARSEQRAEFLRDIITGAVEGGTGYWAQVSQYQWVDDNDGRVAVVVGERVGDSARAVLHRLRDDESGYEAEGLTVDIEVVAKGIGAVLADGFSINSRLREAIKLADRENDAGEIDADAADVIVQAGLFGEIVYG